MSNPLPRSPSRGLPSVRCVLRVRGGIGTLGLSLAGLGLSLTGTARAQVVTVDEGTFSVTRAGAMLGREEFRIVRQPGGSGPSYAARSVALYEGRRLTPALQTDASGEPVRYQIEVRRGPALDERVSAELSAGGHFTARSQRGGREGAREYLLPAGEVVADHEVYHQLFFLAQRALAGLRTVHVLVPRSDTQLTVAVERVGAEPVAVGGQSVPATHFTLTDARAGWRRELWVDNDGRVLRVLIPGTALTVVRDDPPT